MPKPLPKLQRVAAYALVLRDDRILLTRLASRISADEKWHLPGGGVDHGENPRDALVREIREETGLDAEVGDTARVYSAHLPVDVAQGPALGLPGPPHRVRRVGAAPTPPSRGSSRSTARPSTWAGTRSPTCSPAPCPSPRSSPRRWPTTGPSGCSGSGSTAWSGAATPSCSPGSRRSDAHPGSWTLPGGGLDHGEAPRDALAREVRRGVRARGDGRRPARRPRRPLRRHGARPVATRTSTASTWSSGRRSPDDVEPHVVETGGTTDAVAFVPVADIEAGPPRRCSTSSAPPWQPTPRLDRVHPRHRRLVIPVALGALLLIVVIASAGQAMSEPLAAGPGSGPRPPPRRRLLVRAVASGRRRGSQPPVAPGRAALRRPQGRPPPPGHGVRRRPGAHHQPRRR